MSVIVAFGSPIATGLTLTGLIYVSQDFSGGHFNPAVTLMHVFNRTIGVDNAVAYIAAQISGGILAAMIISTLRKRGVL